MQRCRDAEMQQDAEEKLTKDFAVLVPQQAAVRMAPWHDGTTAETGPPCSKPCIHSSSSSAFAQQGAFQQATCADLSNSQVSKICLQHNFYYIVGSMPWPTVSKNSCDLGEASLVAGSKQTRILICVPSSMHCHTAHTQT